MMKLRATNPLVLFVGALAIGLAGCADDVIITEPPPPPPPPPPESAEISIVSITDADTETEVGESEDDPIGGTIGVIINFDTGGFEAAALDVFVDSDQVPCQTFSGQGSVGLSADVQTVQCIIDTEEGIGACEGSTLLGRFSNGPHVISAELTLDDGSSVRATRAQPVVFANSNTIQVVPDDIGPRVVGTDAQGWWGGPRDLSWFACPVIFTTSLDDVCEITVQSSGPGNDLILSGSRDAGTDSNSDTSEEPFEYVAQYRDVPALVEGIANPDWVDSESNNEDWVEQDATDLNVTTVLACDGTNITSSFSLDGPEDSRPIDLSAPLCDDDPCEIWIDNDYPINDGNDDGLTNNLFSGGDFDLRDEEGDIVDDDGVGLVLGETTQLNAWDVDSFDGDLLDLTLITENVFGVDDLDEDDACGFDETTDPVNNPGAATFEATYGQCTTGGAGDDGGIDAYVIQIAKVADLLGNALGDGTEDQAIEDEFITELDDNGFAVGGTGLGVVVSGQLGADFTAPEIDPDELQPPADDPIFVWNPDLGLVTPFDPADRDCPNADPALCESMMWEAVDPDLASGDPGSGVEDVACDPGPCINGNPDWGDTDKIVATVDDSPGDAINDNELVTNNAGLDDDMFQALICDGGAGAQCDGTDDGTYTVTHTVPDKAQAINNVAEATYSFIIDTNPPIIGFGGITGLNASNAATVEFVLDASVVDRNGDGTAVTTATVQVTLAPGLDFDCGLGAPSDEYQDVLVTPPNNPDPTDLVIVDVTAQVNANGGDFSQTFTAENQGPNLGLGAYTYCFEIVADDGAERKDGTDDDVEVEADAGKNFTWQ